MEVLSSPIPSVQLPRIKRVYFDLLEALGPLFPPKHIVLLTLEAPPSPTTSPLLSTVTVLSQILSALRERCAPIRDAQIDSLLADISLPPPLLPFDDSKISPLAQFVVDNVKAILSLSEDMKADLNDFVLGSMSEDQLMSALSSTVKTQERENILWLWSGQDAVRASWRGWLSEGTRRTSIQESSNKWIDRLIRALESDQAVLCVPPSALPNEDPENVNRLPPQLFFSTPALLFVQNYLQAIIITAALRILARPSSQPNRSDITKRVWTLLLTEVHSDNPHYSDTKIINLADEVVRARRQSPNPNFLNDTISEHNPLEGNLSPEEETRLRASVDRALRSTDPVFLLLRRRLLDALEMRLLVDVENDFSRPNGPDTSPNAKSPRNHSIPAKMQTGRDLAFNRKRPKLVSGTQPTTNRSEFPTPAFHVQGFDDPILEDAISVVYGKLAKCILWTESVWGDLV